MKNFATNNLKLIASCLLICFITAGIANAQVIEPPEEPSELQDLPFTFNMDTEEVDWEGFTFFPFEGAALERIENPDQSGLNDSDYVLQYVKAGGEFWAGFFYHTEGEIEITDETVFRLNVWSNTDEVSAMMKLEMRDAPDVESAEMFVDVHTEGEWIELEWDLSGVDRDTPWDRVVIIFDLEEPAGDGSARYTWYLDDFTIDSGEVTSNEIAEAGIPQSLQLNQNYPNPFNPTTNIEFALPQSSHATLEVFDMLGQRVATLVDDNLSAGQHSATFDASHLTSGVYIYRLQAGNYIQTRKLTLIK